MGRDSHRTSLKAMIQTFNVNNRSDWFEAVGKLGTKVYISFAEKRHDAFKQVLWEMYMDNLMNA